MYLYLGEKTVVNTDDIIGVFDLDTATVKKSTRLFLEQAEKDGRLITVLGEDLPKSFVVVKPKNAEKAQNIIYISQISPTTIIKRLK